MKNWSASTLTELALHLTDLAREYADVPASQHPVLTIVNRDEGYTFMYTLIVTDRTAYLQSKKD